MLDEKERRGGRRNKDEDGRGGMKGEEEGGTRRVKTMKKLLTKSKMKKSLKDASLASLGLVNFECNILRFHDIWSILFFL